MATIIVTSLNDSGPDSLRQAIIDAAPGDTIQFDPSLGGQTIALASELLIDKDLIIDGDEGNPVTIDAGGQATGEFRVFNIDDGKDTQAQVTIDGVRITGGYARVIGSDNNHGNDNDGGGIFTNEALTLSNSTVTGNIAADNAGGVYVNDLGSANIVNTTISNNEANYDGGGVLAFGNTNITDSTITNNITLGVYAGGGGVFNAGGTATISNSTISGNSANDTGGGIYTIGTGNTTITESTITGNTANHDAGGVFVYGETTITNTTISDNIATSAIADGGGVSAHGNVTIENSTINGNSAGDDGGGVYIKDDVFGHRPTATITNSTISSNTANSDGGGVFNFGAAEINNSTITLNEAINGQGDGIASIGDKDITSTTVTSSIVSGNVDNNDVDIVDAPVSKKNENTFTSGGNNLIGTGNATGSFNHTDDKGKLTDQTGVTDPGLEPLGDFGGPTQTHALQAGSAAINAGNPLDLETDQRGTGSPRVVDGAADIGAFEFNENSIFGTENGDLLSGDNTDNSIYGLAGDDLILGSEGNDTIFGNDGDDFILSDGGDDLLFGGNGNDQLQAGDGIDQLFGGTGDDTLRSGLGNDTLSGEAGNDLLNASDGDDSMLGGAGNDTLIGGENNDTLDGGLGSDSLFGGAGSDIFLLRSGDGTDQINDYQDGQDQFLLDGLAFSDLTITQSFSDTILQAAGEDLATLIGISAATIDSGDFVTI